jgi:hypothetical protein
MELLNGVVGFFQREIFEYHDGKGPCRKNKPPLPQANILQYIMLLRQGHDAELWQRMEGSDLKVLAEE